MKNLQILIVLVIPAILLGQVNKDSFSISLSIYNHAEMIFDGVTTYKLSGERITIRKRFLFSEIDTLLFSKMVGANTVEKLKSIRLDTLKDIYINWCVMVTSGNEYNIFTLNNKFTKSIYLHHFYRKEIVRLVNEINKVIPTRYKIHYLTNKPENKCDDINQAMTD